MNELCERCGAPAEFTDSIPDANTPGINKGECGYRPVYLCSLHARARKLYVGNTTRIQRIEETER